MSLIYFLVDKKRAYIIKRYFVFVQNIFSVFLLGSAAGFVLLFVIAFFQMNILSALTHTFPRSLGVETNIQQIVENLKLLEKPPDIVVGSEEKNLLPSIAQAQAGKNSFYGSRVVARIPDFLIFSSMDTGSDVLMIGNTLIITKIDSEDFQLVSPVLSHLFIDNYFANRQIKSYPTVSLMDELQYRQYREEDYSKKAVVFDEVIAQLSNNIRQLPNTIADSESLLRETQEDLEQARLQRERDFISCVNEGFYENNVFVKTNSREDCEERVADQEEDIDDLKQNIHDLENSLESDRQLFEQYQAYLEYYNNQKMLIDSESGLISYEFASFEPPDDIQMSVDSRVTTQSLADYFALLIHEYLHFATYQEDKRLSSAFFNEGLTEYFARRIVKSSLGIDTNLGYPINVSIVGQMTKRISESDLADIYFSNDQSRLEELVDRAYGEEFYRSNIILLETLHYTPNRTQILFLANEFMTKIGGELLTEADLESTRSVYR